MKVDGTGRMTEFGEFPEMQTERLLLRRMTIADAGFYLELFSDPEVVELTAFDPPNGIEGAKRELMEYCIRPFDENRGIRWGIVLKSKAELIRTIGYINWVKARGHWAEIGYDLRMTEEASIRGVIAAKKFWNKDIKEACMELGGHNFDREYRYRVLMYIQRPDQVKEAVGTIIKLGPGHMKWINLLFYRLSDKDVYAKIDVIDNLEALKDKIKRNDEKAKEIATGLVRNHLKMDLRKHIVPEYDMAFGYLLRKNDDRVLIAIIGYNFLADDLIRNSLEDFKAFGKFVGYWIDEVKKADIIELDEEEHFYTVLLGI